LACVRSLQPKLNAYITVTEEWALKQAEQEEKEIAAGRYRSLLHGIPFAAKEIARLTSTTRVRSSLITVPTASFGSR
jgi:aspartyl-tRNA(Asn)/glutamyl-tRNA(Gln) amidotransferase subunit A